MSPQPITYRRPATITGDDPDPIRTILTRFQARYLTIWRLPVFASLSAAAASDPRSTLVFEDPDYLVFDLDQAKAERRLVHLGSSQPFFSTRFMIGHPDVATRI